MAQSAPVPKKKARSGAQMNVRYSPTLIKRIKAAAEWEGLNFSTYVRSKLLRAVRATEAERAREEGGKAGR